MKAYSPILPIWIVLAIALSPLDVKAEKNGRISGSVFSAKGAGLLGAVITIFKHDQDSGTISFTRSGKNGAYSLANLAPGSYYLQVSREGFQPLAKEEVKIEPGKTTTMNIILEEFLDFISAAPDPRNWDLKTVMRSTSDRRLIFRDLPGGPAPFIETQAPFSRGGTLRVVSSTGLGSESYMVFPSSGPNGVSTNFAYVEPVSDHGRVIFSGQLYSGYDSYWRMRNTYNYRPNPGRDIKVSFGYGQLSLDSNGSGRMSHPGELFDRDPARRESGIQTFAFGMEGSSRLLDLLSLDYGFDLTRVHYGTTKSVFSPFLEVAFTPAETWVFKSILKSRRFSDNSSLSLPDGEVLNLVEPTYIAKVGDQVNVSQFKHAEFSLAKTFMEESEVEVAVYQDSMEGPGMPFMATSDSVVFSPARLIQLRQDQTRNRGLRLAMNRKILDYLSGSIAYVYGSGTNVSAIEEHLSSEALANNLLNYMQTSYYHVLTGRVRAAFPFTHTHVAAVVRWYPGQALTPIDLFGDRMDLMTKGVSLSIRQPIPVPEFMAASGRWEALVDVRNMFDQGRTTLPTNDGSLLLTRNPRSLRFGINLNLY